MRSRESCSALSTLLTLVLALLLTPAALPGQEKEGPNAEGAVGLESPAVVAIEDVALANHLARFGMINQRPEALVLAADILLQAGAQELDVEKEHRGEGDDEQPAEGEGEITPSRLVALAREMAEPGSAALQMIENLEERPVERGARGGPRTANDCVLARSTDLYTITFRGGEDAVVSVIGDGDTDLDVYVYDENGHLLVSDRGYSDRALVAWRPIWTGPFLIEIRNLGLVYNCYGLATN